MPKSSTRFEITHEGVTLTANDLVYSRMVDEERVRFTTSGYVLRPGARLRIRWLVSQRGWRGWLGPKVETDTVFVATDLRYRADHVLEVEAVDLAGYRRRVEMPGVF